jgi:hypothetical protein
MTGLLLHSRALHSTLATMEHQDTCARLMNEMPRVRSPRRRTIEVQEAPRAAPATKPLAQPLVFRKTKRELEREQQQAQAREQPERMQSRKRRLEEEELRESTKVRLERPKCVRTLEWSCRRTSQYRSGTLRTQSRRR